MSPGPCPSTLHRFLGLAPGEVPVWLLSRDSCAGLDLLSSLLAVFGVAGIMVGSSLGIWWGLVSAVPIIPFGLLVVRFDAAERWARARRRRGECVWCGHAEAHGGHTCPSIGAKTAPRC